MYRAAGTYEDMRTGPHHVFRIERGKIRILLILIINTDLLFNFELEKIVCNIVQNMNWQQMCLNDDKSVLKNLRSKKILHVEAGACKNEFRIFTNVLTN